MHYLIRCSPTNPKVVDWVRRELKRQVSVWLLMTGNLWDCLAPFALKHPEIRASVIQWVRSNSGRHNLDYVQSLIVELGGDELRDELIRIARAAEGWSVFWAVAPLLEGWGRSDPSVALLLSTKSRHGKTKDCKILQSILPRILTNFYVCRTRLLSLARDSDRPRFDLIAGGLAALGCTAGDTEVIDTLLAAIGKGLLHPILA